MVFNQQDLDELRALLPELMPKPIVFRLTDEQVEGMACNLLRFLKTVMESENVK